MQVGRLLYHLRNNILHDKSSQAPGAVTSDYLWDDQTLIDYMNEAHRRFAMASLCIRDGVTPEVCQVQQVAYQREYVLHESVVAVVSVRCEGDHADLARAGHSQFNTYRTPDAYFFDPGSLSYQTPGKVKAFDSDEYVSPDDFGSMQVVTMRTWPAPAPPHIQLMKLRVIRKPLQEFTTTAQGLAMVPEIPNDHHMDMLNWAAYLALRIVDRDGGDPARAEGFKNQFDAETARARTIALRKMFTPLSWGFGRNGFSYERDGEGY